MNKHDIVATKVFLDEEGNLTQREITFEEMYKMDINITITEEQRQLMIRALALQSIEAPGFCHAIGEIVSIMHGEEMFDTLADILADSPPCDRFNRDSKVAEAMKEHFEKQKC